MTIILILILLIIYCVYILKRNDKVRDFLLNLVDTEEDYFIIREAVKGYKKMVFIHPFKKLTLENFLGNCKMR